MNGKIIALFGAVLSCFIVAADGVASVFEYTAIGSVIDKQNQLLPITGDVSIDDQLRNGSGQPTQVLDLIGYVSYTYTITEYSLRVGEYSLSGKGYLWLPLVRYPTLDDWSLGDTEWHLQNTTASLWGQWFGELFYFYNHDGTERDYSQYVTLADSIHLVALMPPPNDPILPMSPGLDLWLYKNEGANPVPDPSTLVLLGTGLAGIAIRRTHKTARFFANRRCGLCQQA